MNKFFVILSILSGFVLFVEISQFLQMAIYIDEFEISLKDIFGGNFWLTFIWVKLFLIFLSFVFSIILIFKKIK